MQRLRFAPAFLAVVLVCAPAAPAALAAQFQTVETADMRLVYASPLESYLVPQVARSFENSLQFHRRLFGYTPSGPINVLMHDLWHYGNAGASPIPQNHITIGIEPYAHDYESAPAPERMTSSLNHEMAHIVTVDKATASDRFYRTLFFGKVTPNAEVPLSMLYSYLTTPRWYAPRWYLEGIAVYLETWMNGGIGRAIGPYDEMVFRTLVKDSARIFDFVGLESEGTTIDFQVGVNSYLYGTRFISYLGLRYGNDSLLAWFNRTEGSRRYFSSQFRHVFGRSLEDEWARWIAWERDWQAANLAAIRRHPVTAFRPLTDHTLGSVSRAYYDSATRAIYVGIRYPGQVAHLAAIDVATGTITNLTEILGASGYYVTALAYDPASRTLFYTTDNADWRNLCALDLATGRTRTLLRNARIGDLAFDRADGSLWGVRHDNGFSTVVRIPRPYREWNQIETLPYGKDLFDLDISPDGSTLIGSMSEISAGQKLVRLDIAALVAKNATPEVLSDFGDWPPSNFVFSPDGKYLFGSSYYSGVSNIYRYDLTRQVMEPLSNTETGFFKPVPLPGDSVVVFRYTARGFVPSMIPDEVPDSVSAINFLGNEIAATRTDVQSWIPPHDSSLNLDSLAASARAYHPLAHLRLNSAYPLVEGYQDAAGTSAVAVGGRASFSDQVGATALNLTASYSPDPALSASERLHLRADFQSWNWRVVASLNRADFYDLFGPTKVSRRGYSLGVQYKGSLFLDDPRSLTYTLRLAGYGHLATLPDYQNVAAPVEGLVSFSGDLAYGSLRRSLGAVEDELGTTARATVYGNYVGGTLFPLLSLDWSHGFLLPLNHSSLWLRASAGSALAGNRGDAFAQFFFGGFGNNWVDYRDIRQFRQTESFPGIGIDDVGGSSYGKAQIEWVLPPLRFRRVGIPSFYLQWADLSFFTTGLETDVDLRASRRTFTSAGAQLDLRLVTLSHLESTLSIGYAVAHQQGVPLHSAGMFSFKIM
ncbi:MAG TPA: hypothetical protein VMC86_01830 [Gemmatimonadales bacterium]|nr:hypothetical protein [Gemmatimonadales bacterium]